MSETIDLKTKDTNYQGMTDIDNTIVNELIYNSLPEDSPLRDKFKQTLLAELKKREVNLYTKEVFDENDIEPGIYVYCDKKQIKVKYKYTENKCSHEIIILPEDLDLKYYNYLKMQYGNASQDPFDIYLPFTNEELESLYDAIRTLIFKKNKEFLKKILESELCFDLNNFRKNNTHNFPPCSYAYYDDEKLNLVYKYNKNDFSDVLTINRSDFGSNEYYDHVIQYLSGNKLLNGREQQKLTQLVKDAAVKSLRIPQPPVKNQRKIDELNASTKLKEATLIENIATSDIILDTKDYINQSDDYGTFVYYEEGVLKVRHKDEFNDLSEEITLSEKDFFEKQQSDFWRIIAYLKGDILLNKQDQQNLWASLKAATIKKVIIPNNEDENNFLFQILHWLFQTSHVYTSSNFLHFLRLGMVRFMGLTENEPSKAGSSFLTSLQMLYGFLLIFDMTVVISNAIRGKGSIQQSLLKGNRIHRMLDSFVWLTVNYIRLGSDSFLHMGFIPDLSASLSFGILSIAFTFDLINQAWANYKDIQHLNAAIEKVESELKKDLNDKDKLALQACESKLKQQLHDKKLEYLCNVAYASTLVAGSLLVAFGESAFFQAAFESSTEVILSGFGIIAGVTALNYARKCTLEVMAANRERKEYDKKVAQLTEIEILIGDDEEKKCNTIDHILDDIFKTEPILKEQYLKNYNPNQDNLEKGVKSNHNITSTQRIESIFCLLNTEDSNKQIVDRLSFFNNDGTVNYENLNEKLNKIDPSYETNPKKEKIPTDRGSYLKLIQKKKKNLEIKSNLAIKNMVCSIAYYSILCAGAIASIFLIGNPWILGAVVGALLIYAVVAKSGLLDKLINKQVDAKYKKLAKEKNISPSPSKPITPQASAQRERSESLPIPPRITKDPTPLSPSSLPSSGFFSRC